LEGIVTRTTGSFHMIRLDDGTVLNCKLKGNLRITGIRTTNPVAVGDRVEVECQPDKQLGFITRILERDNYIIRRATKLSKESHIIAANMDQAVLVATIAFPRTSTGFIDRFLVTSEAYHIPAVLVFNKVDLYTDELLEALDELEFIYISAGYPVCRVSAITGEGMASLRSILKDRVSLMAGHSGVGKSTLINVLEPLLDLKVMEISSYHLKGQHATTFAEMFPLTGGGYIIDTPGIKEFGLTDFNRQEVAERFPEMRAIMHECRYSNCTHTREPGCSVIKAFEEGRIPASRYENYLRIFYGRDWDEDKYN
jgi:ribosome biogenesis GTPase / thiamine phosphate phosphatase